MLIFSCIRATNKLCVQAHSERPERRQRTYDLRNQMSQLGCLQTSPWLAITTVALHSLMIMQYELLTTISSICTSCNEGFCRSCK